MSSATFAHDCSTQQTFKSKPNSAPLRINTPGDTYEQEADQVADKLGRGERISPWSLSSIGLGHVQRQDGPDGQMGTPPKPLTTDDMIKKVGEALLETKEGKAAVNAIKKDPLVKSTTDFLSTPAGIVITGVAATGVVSGLASAHKPLPMQIPKLPLDFIHPGLGVQLNYEGPVNHPTAASITLSFTPSSKKKKDDEKAGIAADIARLRAEQEMFRDKSQDQKLGPVTLPRQPAPQQSAPPAQPVPDVITGADPAASRVAAGQQAAAPHTDRSAKAEDKKREEDLVQRKAQSTHDHGFIHAGSVEDALRGSGRPLDPDTRRFMESRIGFDLGKVRVFTDTSAAQSARSLNAAAYATGNNIVFDSGKYEPHSATGRKLLAHELAHVVQQDRSPLAHASGRSAASSSSLRIGPVHDRFEQEADRAAEKAMFGGDRHLAWSLSRVGLGAVQRKCSCGGASSSGEECEECKNKSLQRRASGRGGENEAAPPIVHEVLRSPGQPLDSQTRAFMEPRFGHDFSNVRVHLDEKAAESAHRVNAHAYTSGRDIVFGRGQYSPSTGAGKALLAHELAHVVQQGFRDASRDDTAMLGPVGDQHEQAADRAAASLGESTARSFSQDTSRVSRAAIQRQAMNCATKQSVEDECSNATANCQSAASDCKSDFPNPGDLDKYIANLKANFATSDFGPNAKRNFGHWLDGSGTELEMPSAVFEAQEATKHALLVHRDKIVEGVQKRLADGRMKPGVVSDVIAFSGHANAFSLGASHSDDLAYSVGGYQLCSNVHAKATAAGDGTYNVDFTEWKCQAFDCYNWDPGKGIGIGMLDDTKLCCVENAGKAKHFLDHSTIWDNKDPDSTKGFSVPGAGSGTTSSSSKTPPKKEDKR